MSAWRARPLAGLMIVTAITVALSCSRAAGPDRDEVKVEVAGLDLDRESGAPVVLLKDKNGNRVLPIWIGDAEARAIMLELHGVKPERPLTSDLLRNMLQTTGNQVDWVAITEMRKQTYYARISLNRGRYLIDSRPSDAIALALGVKAPIYVASRLFEAAVALESSGRDAFKAARAFGITVQELSSEVAAYFNVEPGSGVLVADVNAEAARAGIARGDVVKAVAGRQVRNLREFSDNAAALKKPGPVAVTVERGGQKHTVTVQVPPN